MKPTETKGLKIPASPIGEARQKRRFPCKTGAKRDPIRPPSPVRIAAWVPAGCQALFALTLALAGCASPVDVNAAPGTAYAARAEGFNAAERDELGACLSEWRTFSGGAVDVVLGDSGEDFTVRRGSCPNGPRHGCIRRVDRVVWVDAANLQEDSVYLGVKAMCLRLVGFLFGVPRHNEKGALHVDWSAPYLTSGDHAACVAAGVCR